MQEKQREMQERDLELRRMEAASTEQLKREELEVKRLEITEQNKREKPLLLTSSSWRFNCSVDAASMRLSLKSLSCISRCFSCISSCFACIASSCCRFNSDSFSCLSWISRLCCRFTCKSFSCTSRSCCCRSLWSCNCNFKASIWTAAFVLGGVTGTASAGSASDHSS